MRDKAYQVLFVCTGNSARSILAEAILNYSGAGRFVAHSAGSQPNGTVHPLALATLTELGIATHGLRSKSWAEFGEAGAPQLDFVFTVCDNAAGEVCPVWPGQPMTAHWGLADPSHAEGDEAHQRRAFMETALILKRRIDLMLSLPMASLDALSLHSAVRDIGQR